MEAGPWHQYLLEKKAKSFCSIVIKHFLCSRSFTIWQSLMLFIRDQRQILLVRYHIYENVMALFAQLLSNYSLHYSLMLSHFSYPTISSLLSCSIDHQRHPSTMTSYCLTVISNLYQLLIPCCYSQSWLTLLEYCLWPKRQQEEIFIL